MRERYAVLVIDMLKDFLTGSLKCDRCLKIVPNIKKLIEEARKRDIPVIYICDSHLPSDKELELWGPHAMSGSEGSRVIDELAPKEGDIVIRKRRYSGFYGTDLDLALRELNINTLILTGIHTHICIQHTAADAFFRAYKIIIPKNCTEALTEEDYKRGLDYCEKMYKAEILDLDSLLRRIGES